MFRQSKSLDPPFHLLLVDRPAIIIMKIITVGFIGIPHKIFDERPLRIGGVLVIGAVNGGSGKSKVVSLHRLRIPLAVHGAVGHALGIGQVQKGRQRSEGSCRIQLGVLKAHQYAVHKQPVLRVGHEAAVGQAVGQIVAHYGYLIVLALSPLVRLHIVMHKAHAGPMAGGNAAHGSEGFDILKILKNWGILYLRICIRAAHGVSLGIHRQVVMLVGKVGLQKECRSDPRRMIQPLNRASVRHETGHQKILVRPIGYGAQILEDPALLRGEGRQIFQAYPFCLYYGILQSLCYLCNICHHH